MNCFVARKRAIYIKLPASPIRVHERVEDHPVPEPRGDLPQVEGGRDAVEETDGQDGVDLVHHEVVAVFVIVVHIASLPPPLALAGEVDGELPEDGEGGVGGGVDGHHVGEDGAHAQREEAGDGRGQGGGQEASRGAAASAGPLVLDVLMREYLEVW